MGIDKVRELTVREIESVDGGVYFLNLNYRSLGGLIRTPMLTFFGIGNTAIACKFWSGIFLLHQADTQYRHCECYKHHPGNKSRDLNIPGAIFAAVLTKSEEG